MAIFTDTDLTLLLGDVSSSMGRVGVTAISQPKPQDAASRESSPKNVKLKNLRQLSVLLAK